VGEDARELFEFPRSTPFAQAVWDAIERQSSLERAVEILTSAERTHGVCIRKAEPDSNDMDEGAEEMFLRKSFFPFLSQTHLVIAGGDFCNWWEVAAVDGRTLYGTWRGWGWVLADWANECWVPAPIFKHMEHKTPPTHTQSASRKWEYIDFYMNGDGGTCFKNYDKWANAVNAVLALKTGTNEFLLDEYGKK